VLVKELRGEGKRDEAEAVQKLSRPNLGAWALNGLARAKPEVVRRLTGAGERLRRAQSGEGDVRAAVEEERRALEAGTSAARDILTTAGRNPTEAVLHTIRTTLRAAAADPDAASALEQGRLTGALEPPDLSSLLANVAPRPPTARAAARKEGARRDDRAQARRRLDEAKARAEEQRAEARKAADEERRALREWERAQKRAQAARERAEGAEEALREAEVDLDRLT
jgi:hypothetical protein